MNRNIEKAIKNTYWVETGLGEGSGSSYWLKMGLEDAGWQAQPSSWSGDGAGRCWLCQLQIVFVIKFLLAKRYKKCVHSLQRTGISAITRESIIVVVTYVMTLSEL